MIASQPSCSSIATRGLFCARRAPASSAAPTRITPRQEVPSPASSAAPGARSYIQPDHAHELERVAVGDDAVSQLVVEAHLAVFDVVLQMHVPDLAGKMAAISVSARSWVVTMPIARLDSMVRTRPSAAMRRSLELVPLNSSSNRNSTGNGPSSRSKMQPDAQRLGVETRAMFLQRIGVTQAGADRQRREPQARGANRRAGERQHGIQSDRPHQRALARHVRAAHDQDLRA